MLFRSVSQSRYPKTVESLLKTSAKSLKNSINKNFKKQQTDNTTENFDEIDIEFPPDVNAIGKAGLGLNVFNKGDTPFGRDNFVYDEATGIYKRGKIAINPNTADYKFAQGGTITDIINQVILISDEMKGQAILQLTQIGLQFDESKSNNPFAYFTQIIYFAFLRRIDKEKKQLYVKHKAFESAMIHEEMYDKFDDSESYATSYTIDTDKMNDFVTTFESRIMKKKEKKPKKNSKVRLFVIPRRYKCHLTPIL